MYVKERKNTDRDQIIKATDLVCDYLSMKYAFPGNVALDVIDTDCDGTEKDVCRMTEK